MGLCFAGGSKEVTVSFLDSDSLTTYYSIKCKSIEDVIDIKSPTKDGFEFLYWSASRNGERYVFDEKTKLDKDFSLYAVWKPLFFNVTIEYDGKIIDSIQRKYGQKILPIPSYQLTKEHYYIAGWQDSKSFQTITDATIVSSDLSISPIWKKETRHVIIVDSNNHVLQTSKVEYGERLDLEELDIDKQGYRFIGLEKQTGELFDYSSPIIDDIVLTAIFKKMYLVSFYSDDEPIDSYLLLEGEKIVPPENPSKMMSIFLGWTIAGTEQSYDFNSPVFSNINLSAVWKARIGSYLVIIVSLIIIITTTIFILVTREKKKREKNEILEKEERKKELNLLQKKKEEANEVLLDIEMEIDNAKSYDDPSFLNSFKSAKNDLITAIGLMDSLVSFLYSDGKITDEFYNRKNDILSDWQKVKNSVSKTKGIESETVKVIMADREEIGRTIGICKDVLFSLKEDSYFKEDKSNSWASRLEEIDNSIEKALFYLNEIEEMVAKKKIKASVDSVAHARGLAYKINQDLSLLKEEVEVVRKQSELKTKAQLNSKIIINEVLSELKTIKKETLLIKDKALACQLYVNEDEAVSVFKQTDEILAIISGIENQANSDTSGLDGLESESFAIMLREKADVAKKLLGSSKEAFSGLKKKFDDFKTEEKKRDAEYSEQFYESSDWFDFDFYYESETDSTEKLMFRVVNCNGDVLFYDTGIILERIDDADMGDYSSFTFDYSGIRMKKKPLVFKALSRPMEFINYGKEELTQGDIADSIIDSLSIGQGYTIRVVKKEYLKKSDKGVVKNDKPNHIDYPQNYKQLNEKRNGLGSLLKELDSMIGLESVKIAVHEIVNQVIVSDLKKKKGGKVSMGTMHMVFTGNPGTGKTTVARIISKIFKTLGFLNKGTFMEVSRADLVAEYMGQTAPKTTATVQKALGGVLFIDEAYSLYKGPSDEYGTEAIDTLIQLMENYRDNLIVIIAGYTEQINDFLTSANPGLESRFKTKVHFEDYNSDELSEIFFSMCKAGGYRLTDDSLVFVREGFQSIIANKPNNFGNARVVRNIYEETEKKQCNRIAHIKNNENLSKEELYKIEIEDISFEIQ